MLDPPHQVGPLTALLQLVQDVPPVVDVGMVSVTDGGNVNAQGNVHNDVSIIRCFLEYSSVLQRVISQCLSRICAVTYEATEDANPSPPPANLRCRSIAYLRERFLHLIDK